MKTLLKSLLLAVAVLLAHGATAQEATIRKAILERLPQIKSIDEVSKTPIPGVYELRINGSEIYYTDA